MNKVRRKRLTDAIAAIAEQLSNIEQIRDEEEQARENLPQSLQDSERGQEMALCIDTLEHQCSEIESALEEMRSYT